MLQNVRDNMKGTIAVIVVIIFVVPMVLTGIQGSGYLSNVAGNDAAKVNKRSISKTELNRAITQRREAMKAQGVDATSEQLKDENLAGPVLQSLTQQAAVVTKSENVGMGVSDKQIFSAIKEAPQFQVDGKFDNETYKRAISYQGHTPTTFKKYVGDILLVQQSYSGINDSAFVTDAEVDAMIAIAQEKRSFSTIEIPSKDFESGITVSDDEISTYYQGNQSEFIEPEKMSIEYIELSVDELMKGVQVSEQAIADRYNLEKQDFESQGSEAEVQIAHLMLDKKDDGSQQATIDEINARLEAGEDFAALVKEYSVDEGSRDNGGDLGVLIKGAFSEEFEQAALALAEGEVSAPVETDSGVHIIKSLKKSVKTFPTLEEKSASIAQMLKRTEAEELYASREQNFEDLTFSASDLKPASETLGLPIKTSDLFQRGSGTGIAREKAVRDAAWIDDVLQDGRNSPKIQLGAGHAVVVRRKDHVAEHVLALEKVKTGIEAKLKEEKLATVMEAKAQELIDALENGGDAKALAEEKAYTLNDYKQTKRFEAPVDFEVRELVFKLPAGENTVYDSVNKSNGDAVVVAVSEVIKGQRSDMPAEQVEMMRSQLLREDASAEFVAYQTKLVNDSKIKSYLN